MRFMTARVTKLHKLHKTKLHKLHGLNKTKLHNFEKRSCLLFSFLTLSILLYITNSHLPFTITVVNSQLPDIRWSRSSFSLFHIADDFALQMISITRWTIWWSRSLIFLTGWPRFADDFAHRMTSLSRWSQSPDATIRWTTAFNYRISKPSGDQIWLAYRLTLSGFTTIYENNITVKRFYECL